MSDSDVRSRMADAAAPAYDAPLDPTGDLTRGLRARNRRRHRRLALATVGGTAVVALGAGGLLALNPATPDGGTTTDLTPAAYSVKEADGQVKVTADWDRMDAEKGEQLERDIEAHGIAAEVDVNMDGKFCGGRPRYRGLPPSAIAQKPLDEAGDLVLTLDPADYSPTETIVINAGLVVLDNGKITGVTEVGVADAPVPPCDTLVMDPSGE